MKSHISATIDENLVKELKRFGLQERRSCSQVIEMALDAFLSVRSPQNDAIVTSNGSFKGSFSREDTYER